MTLIHAESNHLDTIKNILSAYPNTLVFGSRINNIHNKFSDLDICLKEKKAVPIEEIANLKEKFEESNIPYKIDLVDYHKIQPSFQKIIDSKSISLFNKSTP